MTDFSDDDDDFFKNNTKKKKKHISLLLPHWGFGLGVAPTTIEVKSKTASYTLKSTNFVVKVSYDKPLKKKLSLLLGGSLLPISGSQVDSTLGVAKFEANYTALEASLRMNLLGSPIQGLWLGGGASYLFIGKGSSNVVSASSITSRFVTQINVGYNAEMGSEYLMFRFDYYIHPNALSAAGSVAIAQTVLSASYFY